MDNTGNYGGSIKEAGGSFGSYAKAKEEVYFREQDQKKIEELSKNKEKSIQTSQFNASNQDNKK
jgi:hypothetical protein